MNGLRLASLIVGAAGIIVLTVGIFILQGRLAIKNDWLNGQSVATTAQSDEMPPDSYALQQNLNRHAPGTSATVYVNPQRISEVQLNMAPNIATLGLPLWLLLAAVPLILVSISFWLMGAPGIIS